MVFNKLIAAISVAAAVAPSAAAAPNQHEARASPPSFKYAGDPPYGATPSELSSILTCPMGNPTAKSKPVLLVHGTGSTGNESWGQGYVPALTKKGYTPCYVDLPNRAMSDMQVSSAYIAYNLHYLSYLAQGTPLVGVIGHSQGNPDIQWALHFFPSTRRVTKSYVGLSPDLAGVGGGPISECGATGAAGLKTCQPSIWQQGAGSHYYAALNLQGHTAQIPTTLIWSETDEVVIPARKNAQLPGSISIPVQSLCPGRVTDHFTMVTDAAGFALATDALAHHGHASLARVKTTSTQPGANDVCLETSAKGMDVTIPATLQALFNDVVLGFAFGYHKVKHEPAIKKYARVQNQ